MLVVVAGLLGSNNGGGGGGGNMKLGLAKIFSFVWILLIMFEAY